VSNETLIKDAEELAVTVHSFDVGLKHQILRKLAAALRRTESERDAQHEQVLRLTGERDELRRRVAELEFLRRGGK
jgi:hypothetical protein